METKKTVWLQVFFLKMLVTYSRCDQWPSPTDIKKSKSDILQTVLSLLQQHVKDQDVKMKSLAEELSAVKKILSQCDICTASSKTTEPMDRLNLTISTTVGNRTFPIMTTTTIKTEIQTTPNTKVKEFTVGELNPTMTMENTRTLSNVTMSANNQMSTNDEPLITMTEITQTTQTPSKTIRTGSRGKEFLILFMSNYYETASLSIYVTTDKDANVNLITSPYLEADIKSAVYDSLHFNSDTKISLPPKLIGKYLIIEPKAVILQSSAPLTVFLETFHGGSSDGTLIIPTNKLSTKYLISSTKPYSTANNYNSHFAIGALYERTKINITLKIKENIPVTIEGEMYGDGDIFQITLDKYETFQVNHNTDLSGTFITSTKSIAVFSGNRCQQFKISFCSHLLTQLPPTFELDNEYIVPPFFNNSGTLIQIISESQTNVSSSIGTNTTNWTLRGKEGRNVEVASTETTVVLSLTPVLVTGFGMGSLTNDPYMTVIPGIHQYVNHYKIIIPDGFISNFICVVIQRESINNLQINGRTVDSYKTVYESQVYVNRFYVVRTFEVSKVTYVVKTRDETNFGLIVYGHDRIDGYAFSGNFVFP